MDAANPKRAALRLALLGVGVLMTVGMVAATLRLAGRERPSAAPTDATPPIEVVETSDSYRLPVSESELLDLTPVSATPRLRLMPEAMPTPRIPVYEPPVEEPAMAMAPEPAADANGGVTSGGWTGPLTIHNPAAMGPPEEDVIPAYPTAATPRRVAAMPMPAPQLVAPAPTYEQPEDEPAPPELELAAPAALGTTRLAEVDSARLALDEPSTPSWQEVLAAEPARSLRNLAEPDSEAIESYTASTTDLSRRLAPEVQAGFQLGKSGAVFAARAKFVEVLRRVAMAKDSAQSTTVYSEALADGLRTLDDADDFVPKGNTLEAELDVESIARSHGVQLASAERAVAPHEAVARYSQHAATRLAEAVAGEQAGSMALYGLGKTYDRLEAQSGDATAGRKCAVMYRAAVDAHGENYLAANELGVRLAKSGRYEQASRVLRRAASQPAAIAAVHANLAAVEQRLGNQPTAELARRHSEMLAQRERLAGAVSQRHGVDWVDTQSFRQAPIEPALAPPAGAGGVSSFWRTARKATGWQEPAPAAGPPSVPTQRVVR